MADLFREIRNKFTGWPGAVGVIERKRVPITSAEIKALFTTPKTLVAAPGAGFCTEVLGVSACVDAGATPYTGANALEIRYTNGAGTKVTGDIAAACINSSTDRVDKAVAVAATMTVNAAVVACVPTANPGAGDGTIILDIEYRTIKVTA